MRRWVIGGAALAAVVLAALAVWAAWRQGLHDCTMRGGPPEDSLIIAVDLGIESPTDDLVSVEICVDSACRTATSQELELLRRGWARPTSTENTTPTDRPYVGVLRDRADPIPDHVEVIVRASDGVERRLRSTSNALQPHDLWVNGDGCAPHSYQALFVVEPGTDRLVQVDPPVPLDDATVQITG